MNFSKGHNVFSDIPGFEASKGERIVKALQRLWEKIESLEQIRISEKKSRPEEIQSNSEDADLTITDVQYKLLILQLQYARSILRKKLDKNSADYHSKIIENNQKTNVSDTNYPRKNEYYKDIENKDVSQETQTREHLKQELNPPINTRIPKDAAITNVQVTTDDQLLKSESPFEHSASVTYKTTNSKPHYHLNLDDVPFILGASSTASHSVVANVQNIIAMMKTHNKALCGPKHHVSRAPAVNTHYPEGNTQDATKMLNDLSRDLYELALKQQKLVKSIDAAQGKTPASNLAINFQDDKGNNICDVKQKYGEDHGSRRFRSSSESETKLHADVKNVSRKKEKNPIKSSMQQKQSTSNARNQPNISIMDRRKLLRSLQNFKSHLSEEDISWD